MAQKKYEKFTSIDRINRIYIEEGHWIEQILAILFIHVNITFARTD